MRKSNLTYEQLIELAPKDRPFQIEVNDKTIPGTFWAYIKNKEINFPLGGLSDFMTTHWKDNYKGTFTLIDEYRNMYEKPEVLEVGTEVEILESAKDCGNYESWLDEVKDMIGKVFIIKSSYDNDEGVSYGIKDYIFPYYFVRPVEKVEEKEETSDDLTVKLLINDLEELLRDTDDFNHSFVQDIVNKYKK